MIHHGGSTLLQLAFIRCRYVHHGPARVVVPAVGILYVVAFRVTLGGGGEMAGSCLHFPRSLRDTAGEGRALDSLRSARDISDGAAAVSVHDEVRAKCRLWM